MPTYHFICDNCGLDFTEQLPMGSGLPKCPTCKNAKKVRKIIKPPMVHFKGSGFYKTDSGAKPVKQVAPAVEAKPIAPASVETKVLEKKVEPKK